MLQIDVRKITGRQIHRVILSAIRHRKVLVGKKITKTDFCEEAGLSRTTLYRWENGDKPDYDGLMKVYVGLKKWGFEVELKV